MALLLLPLILLLIITLFFTTSYHYFHRFRYNLPPGPRPLPFVGNVYDLKPVLVRCFSEWANTYGPIFSVYLGSQLNVVVSSPELAKQVLEDNDEKLANRNRTDMINKISNYGADMIWADYGPHYVKLRKLCTLELFTAKRVEALRPIREDEVTAMVESIYNDYCTSILQPAEKKGKPILLRKYLAMMTFLHITRLTFGKRFIDSNGIFDKQGQQLKSILDDNVTSGGKIKSYFGFIPGYNYMFKDEVNELDHRIKRSIDFTKVIMEEQTRSRHNTGNTKSHFVDAMLTLQEEYQLSEDNITGLLWDMIAAGPRPTSISIGTFAA